MIVMKYVTSFEGPVTNKFLKPLKLNLEISLIWEGERGGGRGYTIEVVCIVCIGAKRRLGS